jgi:hypothetical protein
MQYTGGGGMKMTLPPMAEPELMIDPLSDLIEIHRGRRRSRVHDDAPFSKHVPHLHPRLPLQAHHVQLQAAHDNVRQAV